MSLFKEIYLNNRRRLLTKIVRKKLNLKDISLISMNCIGGIVYHDMQQKFLSPTVNLFFKPDDFIKFVNNIDYYISLTPNITMGENYPIGKLDDITIYFMHFTSVEEAYKKWEERKQRINKDKIFVIMVERDGFTKENFDAFQKIKYPKLLFTKTKEYQCDNSLCYPKFKNLPQLPDIIPGRYIYYKMKLVDIINSSFNN